MAIYERAVVPTGRRYKIRISSTVIQLSIIDLRPLARIVVGQGCGAALLGLSAYHRTVSRDYAARLAPSVPVGTDR